MVNHQRPINLDLASLKHPLTSIVSVLHRISGVILFLLLPLMLYLLGESLHSVASFDQLHVTLASPYYKLLVWAFCAALVYHILAGLRHLSMDMGFGEYLGVARTSAVVVIMLAIILTIIIGVCIW